MNYQCDNECYALKGAGYQSCVPNGKEVKSMWSPEEQSYCESKYFTTVYTYIVYYIYITSRKPNDVAVMLLFYSHAFSISYF